MERVLSCLQFVLSFLPSFILAGSEAIVVERPSARNEESTKVCVGGVGWGVSAVAKAFHLRVDSILQDRQMVFPAKADMSPWAGLGPRAHHPARGWSGVGAGGMLAWVQPGVIATLAQQTPCQRELSLCPAH